MSIIYTPSGKAREYADLAANLYAGCSHACAYCYAPAACRRTPEQFRQAAPRADVLAQLSREAPAHRDAEVHLCFTCDPYQPLETSLRLTRQALGIFTTNGVRARILTKGGTRALDDLPYLVANRALFGATLTFCSAKDSRKWEPGAALPSDRLEALSQAKAAGLETWASFEPVIDPAQTLDLIRSVVGVVDVFKVGKWNHDARAKEIDWPRFAREAQQLLDDLGVRYYLKDDLRKHLPSDSSCARAQAS
jgi:DNA repair photolyase